MPLCLATLPVRCSQLWQANAATQTQSAADTEAAAYAIILECWPVTTGLNCVGEPPPPSPPSSLFIISISFIIIIIIVIVIVIIFMLQRAGENR